MRLFGIGMGSYIMKLDNAVSRDLWYMGLSETGFYHVLPVNGYEMGIS